MRQALQEGLQIDNLQQEKVFEPFILNGEYWGELLSDTTYAMVNYFNIKDTSLYHSCAWLMHEDQKNNRIRYKIFYRIFGKLGDKKYYKENQYVFDSTFAIIKQYGYIGARTMGVNYDNHYEFARVNSVSNLSSHALASVLYHSRGLTDRLKCLIDSALYKGEIHPRHYAMIYDFDVRASVENTKDAKQDVTYPYRYMFGGPDDNQTEIDENRKKIGLHSQKVTLQFVMFCAERNIYPFYIPYN